MCDETLLTNEGGSYNHGILVVGQHGDVVCVLGRAEMKHIPHVLAFVAHGLGPFRGQMEAHSRLLVSNSGGEN